MQTKKVSCYILWLLENQLKQLPENYLCGLSEWPSFHPLARGATRNFSAPLLLLQRSCRNSLLTQAYSWMS